MIFYRAGKTPDLHGWVHPDLVLDDGCISQVLSWLAIILRLVTA
jgi:hypothetical protein